MTLPNQGEHVIVRIAGETVKAVVLQHLPDGFIRVQEFGTERCDDVDPSQITRIPGPGKN